MGGRFGDIWWLMDGPTLKLGRNGALTITGLVVVVVLAWVYLLAGAHIGVPMIGLGGDQSTAISSQWSLGYAATVVIMWAAMMVAVMVPSATKVVLLAATLDGQERSLFALRSIAEFVAGYLVVWLGFGLVATALQWALDEAGLLSAPLATSDHILAGSLLLYAGVYQWTPLKQACLTHCRAPQDFLARHWRQDGPFGTGLRHGLFCFGCCWMLMGLLFVGGIMNLMCIAAIAVVIVVEKTLPHGIWTGRVIGTTLVAAGTVAVASLDAWRLFLVEIAQLI